MASPTTTRNLQDALLSANAALPNAANTVNTNGIDLGATSPYPVTEKITVKIETTAGNGANNKNINLRLMDSADNSTFANVALVANPCLRVTDADNAGYAASSVTLSLPPNIRRYIRATALGEANGGDASNGTFTIKLLF
jgi:hypothetical protein